MSSPDLRWVFDTCSIQTPLSTALLFEQSVPGEAFHAALKSGKILVSEPTVAELSAVSGAQEVRSVSGPPGARSNSLRCCWPRQLSWTSRERIRACRDAEDDKFLDVAVAGSASCLVSGDADLLELNPFRGVPILSPAEFSGVAARSTAAGALSGFLIPHRPSARNQYNPPSTSDDRAGLDFHTEGANFHGSRAKLPKPPQDPMDENLLCVQKSRSTSRSWSSPPWASYSSGLVGGSSARSSITCGNFPNGRNSRTRTSPTRKWPSGIPSKKRGIVEPLA